MICKEKPLDISVIIPCRNEEKHIRTTIDRLRRQQGAGQEFSYEVLIVDGQSTDRTIEIINREILDTPEFRIVTNYGRITPMAFNLGIRESTGRFVSIISAHAEVGQDYLLKCLEVSRRTCADNVGGPRRTKGLGYIGQSIALAYLSPVAVGGATNHNLNYEGPVQTVPGGFFKRGVFDRIGYYDETLIRNQDDELNLRLIRSGGKIWQSPQVEYVYVCRSKLTQLFSQYFQYGFWKVYIIEKHQSPASFRHVVPGAFVAALLLMVVLTPISTIASWFLTGTLTVYFFVLFLASLTVCFKENKWRHVLFLPIIFAILHVSYGTGFLMAAFRSIALRLKRYVMAPFGSVQS